jgi:norsolorinic acid ketoreductase
MELTDLQEHMVVNAYGAIRLFQATWPLLDKSRKPVFLLNSAGAASIGCLGSGSGILPRFPLVSYAASKLRQLLHAAAQVRAPQIDIIRCAPRLCHHPEPHGGCQKAGVPVEGLSVDESVYKLLSMVCIRDLELDYGRFGLLPLLI